MNDRAQPARVGAEGGVLFADLAHGAPSASKMAAGQVVAAWMSTGAPRGARGEGVR